MSEPQAWADDDARNRSLYRSLLAEHGVSPRALNWSGEGAQRDRFDVIFEAGIPSGSSVLDVGCGLGDLRAYLLERGHTGPYVGLDLTPEMVSAAQSRFPEARFEVANLMEAGEPEREGLVSDVVVASGIFYLRRHDPGVFMHDMIGRLFGLARQTLVFNSLSAWADRPAGEGEFRADPLETLAFCRRITPWCLLRHDYHPADFTIAMRRTRRADEG